MIKALFVVLVFVIICAALFFIFNPKNSEESLVTANLQSIVIPASSPKITQLSLESIFNNKNNSQNLPEEELVTVLATGDIIPARSVNYQILQRKNFLWPYENVKDVLKSSDLTLVNLESPQIENCPITNEGMVFCGDEGNIEGLKFAGIDVASLANNHAGNHGEKGVDQTVELLTDNGIEVTGTEKSNLVVKDIKGTKFAFLGFNDISKPQPGISDVDELNLAEQIKKAKEKADVVIVEFHWGTEYTSQPDDRQIFLGHLAVDSGADLVIGNHPHWIQPIEIYEPKGSRPSDYKNKLITYAHGNFIFDQEWSEKTKEGVVGKYTFYKNNLVNVEYIPIKIINYGQPFFLKEIEKQKILNNLKEESYILSKKIND